MTSHNTHHPWANLGELLGRHLLPYPSGQDDMLNRMANKAFSKQAGMA